MRHDDNKEKSVSFMQASNGKKPSGKMKLIFSVLQVMLTAFLIWLFLMAVFILTDNLFKLEYRFELYPVIAMITPVFTAVAYIVFKLKKPAAEKKPETVSAQYAASSVETIPSETIDQKKSIMEFIDEMDGHDFEYFCAELLEQYGYKNVHVTSASGDQGVDIIAIKNGLRYAFQCKRYSSKVGNNAVQQVNTGKSLYCCSKGIVITNNYFTVSAQQIAKATGIELWDRDVLRDKINRKMNKTVPAISHSDAARQNLR